MSLAPNPEQMSQEVTALAVKMEECRALAHLLRSDDWIPMRNWVQAQLDMKIERVLRPDLQVGETTALRAEVWALRRILTLRQSKEQEMVQIADRLKGLHAKMERWHTRGRNGLSVAMDAAESILTQGAP